MAFQIVYCPVFQYIKQQKRPSYKDMQFLSCEDLRARFCFLAIIIVRVVFFILNNCGFWKVDTLIHKKQACGTNIKSSTKNMDFLMVV